MIQDILQGLMNSLVAGALAADPRIAEAKGLLLAAVEENQRKLTGVRPGDPALQRSYDELIGCIAAQRGGKLWFPYLGSGIGNGALVELLDGSVKYDFISGIGVHYWGHSHLKIIEAAIDAAISDTILQGNLQQNGDSSLLVELLLNNSGMDHCFLTTSGAMANENAFKIALQKRFPADRILAFEGCFAGRTLAMSQVSDKPLFREGLPNTLSVDYVPFYDIEDPEGSIARAVSALKRLICRYPKQHALMCCELIQGEGGSYAGAREFFLPLMKILKEEGIAIFADEVQSFGRTSQLFAYQHYGLEEYIDITSIGKLAQVCGTLFRKEWTPRPGLLSQTFTSSSAAIRAGLVIVGSLLNEGYFGQEGKIMMLHRHFVGRLQELGECCPLYGPWGLGAMVAFTLRDGEMHATTKFVHELFNAGVISFIAGKNPSRVRLLMPIGAVTTEDIDNVCSIILETASERGR